MPQHCCAIELSVVGYGFQVTMGGFQDADMVVRKPAQVLELAQPGAVRSSDEYLACRWSTRQTRRAGGV